MEGSSVMNELMSVAQWVAFAHSGDEEIFGAAFWELNTTHDLTLEGAELIGASVRLLTEVRNEFERLGGLPAMWVPFVRIMLPPSEKPIQLNESRLQNVGKSTSFLNVAKRQAPFFWGIWRATQSSMRLTELGNDTFRLILRSELNDPASEYRWEQFQNTLYLFHEFDI